MDDLMARVTSTRKRRYELAHRVLLAISAGLAVLCAVDLVLMRPTIMVDGWLVVVALVAAVYCHERARRL